MYGLYNVGFMYFLFPDCFQLPHTSSLQSGCFFVYFLDKVYQNFYKSLLI